ncbi:tannase/feruloyl esterase family alpha/beta hydrolase [Gluconacetobacter entanii]|uniref:tannase/feruloyl esterase family alpha/beta hydrolase n=1 Tax=Gluconacetobacter entanii TaxID=108528 RepID=UPI001C934966|nr:tannase/feruloyl esterase family alpha/beta hydrolase [Gluconacetobacter entanii]MBY4639968.1 tannase/feruloyl esterase family alpha/beta hydrolase [Gluconacetobacter entanii]MCW4581811.1 tannase/feruloyl esterase family alpha/beta hydrolase [Gluconacetobacter entanii]MCW4585071.1 tannase/feruloyl esterase family alpha/beta hydrolase [Gluconacetobacter entanii]MCW4588767.1 tannase/feruloyl esterase family alpha/beta hydrolase [Gluconacetobacter entanii]
MKNILLTLTVLLAVMGAGAGLLPVPVTPAQAADSASLPVVAPVISCNALGNVDLAPAVGAPVHGQKVTVLQTPKGKFCKVTGQIALAISFEVDLPMEHWTQRFLQGGCGGLCGMTRVGVSNAGACAPALNGEFVMAGDDMGHTGSMMGLAQGAFGRDPQKRIDFAYRANHITTLAAKALTAAFYGRAPKYSYFVGRSDGGREALMEAQRFPDDFDGISAGAPAALFTVQNSFYHAWNVRGNQRADGTSILLQGRVGVLHDAVIRHCDTLSGVKDGILEDPRTCHFDPAWVRCPAGQSDISHCLTAEETQAAVRLYTGATDASGHPYIIGGPLPGSELQWALPATAHGESMSNGIAASAIAYVIPAQVDEKAADLGRFRFDDASFARMSELATLYNAENTNLRAFHKRGGRLILWHGLADQSISPLNTIAYYQGVQREMGVEQTDQFMRFYLLPGVGHCGNGEGFPQVDFLSPLMAWTETGLTPAAIRTERTAQGREPMGQPPGSNGKPPAGGQIHVAPMPSQPYARPNATAIASRPVYPYPYIARYAGAGDVNDARNYRPVKSPVSLPMTFTSHATPLIGPDNQKQYGVRDGRLVVEGAK